MQIANLPFHYEDRQAADELLEHLNTLLKDSDAGAEKEIIQKFLHHTSDVFRFTVIGASSVGKTTLLQKLFGTELISNIDPTAKIYEYRYGEQAGEFPVDAATVRCFLPLSLIKGICVVDMPGTERMKTAEETEAVRSQILKSDVLIAVFSSDDPGAAGVWDLLEKAGSGKLVFVLTNTEQLSEEQKNRNRQRLKDYMEEAGIRAEIFCADHLEELRSHIDRNIICTDPGIQKQRANMLSLKEMLQELTKSFALRKKQYEADLAVVERIDLAMDGFLAESGTLADALKKTLIQDIEQEICAYEKEIVARLEPAKIRERFPGGYDDFVHYLNFVSDSYRDRLTGHIDQKTQGCVKEYLYGLEQVFDQATGYFRKRESMLAFEDKFYGSLAKSRQLITANMEKSLQKTKDYYHALSDASEELFLKLWAARETYDKKVSGAGLIGGTVGAAAGAAGAAAITSAITGTVSGAVGAAGAAVSGAAAGTAAGGVLSAAVTGATGALTGAVTSVISAGTALFVWPVVILAGAAAISKMAKKIASAKGQEEMEKCVREAVEEFHLDVADTREQMTEKILDTVDEIFKREREAADKTFLDYRRSVHIDGKNIPALEEKLERAGVLMNRMEQIEKEKMLRC